ncbi:hypothetical protein SETIT_1G258600v2 [Setaria italica]|uniref:Uncharacterized protein n=1 Tax=Setaria italica TaxID=4555 RepID=A0A368PRI8_SETIT|nr:hypothetical protein SETIT_1G258600v2 [Setaria italica]
MTPVADMWAKAAASSSSHEGAAVPDAGPWKPRKPRVRKCLCHFTPFFLTAIAAYPFGYPRTPQPRIRLAAPVIRFPCLLPSPPFHIRIAPSSRPRSSCPRSHPLGSLVEHELTEPPTGAEVEAREL